MTENRLPAVLTGPTALMPVTTELYHQIIVTEGRINPDARLLPIDRMRYAEKELVGALVPATAVKIAEITGLLIASFPVRAVVDADTFLRTMAADLKPFPLDILIEVCADIRRTLKFFPTIADVYERADRLRRNRERLLATVRAQIREHDRRDAEADRKRESRPKEQRKAEAARARAAFGSSAPKPEPTPEEAEADLRRRQQSVTEEMRAAGMIPKHATTAQPEEPF